jgi:ABC-type antimicrobial peptide transport system permease subunit
LRKLHGARRSHIGRLVARELGISLLLAATLGLPIAAVGIARYLAPFSDRTPLAYVAMVVALVMAAAVVAAGAARQAWLASTIRPADALR